jgi:hypothetical protein
MPIKVVTANMVNASRSQEIRSGKSYGSEDKDFPIFGTPTEDLLVYIPRVGIEVTENGESVGWLKSNLHPYKGGKFDSYTRCILGLTESIVPGSGYDGSCPFCEAEMECWELVNLKVANEASKRGVPVTSDNADFIAARNRIYDERSVKKAEEWITFPIVVIPNSESSKITPSANAMDEMKAYFVTWRYARYVNKIVSVLEAQPNNPGHPAGLFWLFKYTDESKGDKLMKRDAQRMSQHIVINGTQDHPTYTQLALKAEEISKGFTPVKAAEVLVNNQFLTMKEAVDLSDKVMVQTRNLLAAISRKEAQELVGVGGAVEALGSPEEAIASFGMTPQVNLGVDNTGGVTVPGFETPAVDQANVAAPAVNVPPVQQGIPVTGPQVHAPAALNAGQVPQPINPVKFG